MRLGQVPPGDVERHTAQLGVADHVSLALLETLGLPGFDRATAQAARGVRDDQPEVDTNDASKAATGLAGADRRVEGEQARTRVGIGDAALGAGQCGGVAPFARIAAVFSQRMDGESATAPVQRGFDRLGHPRFIGTGHPKAILDDIQCRAEGACAGGARMHPGIALSQQMLLDLGFGEVARHLYRKAHHQPRVAGLRGALGH